MSKAKTLGRAACWLLMAVGVYLLALGLWRLPDPPLDPGRRYRYEASQQLAWISGGAAAIILGAYFLVGIKNGR